ncbi:hypothetical protein C4579_02240 [Candidatus Microgenomates bacterium]|nr:MAG: hypothetical protein C4579_02240 [Candidatus Microgenomates bacterium]
MPKKTRRQKIATEKRHAQNVHSQFQYSLPTNLVTTKKEPATTNMQLNNHSYLHQDILKTLILGFLFIALEFGLFFASPRLGW